MFAARIWWKRKQGRPDHEKRLWGGRAWTLLLCSHAFPPRRKKFQVFIFISFASFIFMPPSNNCYPRMFLFHTYCASPLRDISVLLFLPVLCVRLFPSIYLSGACVSYSCEPILHFHRTLHNVFFFFVPARPPKFLAPEIPDRAQQNSWHIRIFLQFNLSNALDAPVIWQKILRSHCYLADSKFIRGWPSFRGKCGHPVNSVSKLHAVQKRSHVQRLRIIHNTTYFQRTFSPYSTKSKSHHSPDCRGKT